MRPTPRRWSVVLVALGASLWGTDVVLRRPLAGALSPITIVFYEHLLLSAVLLPLLVFARGGGRRESGGRRQWTRLRPLDWAAVLGIAWGGSAVATVCFTQAILIGNPTTAVLLQKVQPLFVVLLAAALLGERLQRRFWLYLALAMAGAYLVSFGGGGFREPFRAPAAAALLALAAAAGWAASTVLGRYLAPKLEFSTITGLRIVVALPLLVVLSLAENAGRLPPVSVSQLLPLLWLALVPGLAALLLYYRGLQDTPASQAAIAELCFPATAVLLNWVFLGSRFTALQLAGFALLWAVVACMDRQTAR